MKSRVILFKYNTHLKSSKGYRCSMHISQTNNQKQSTSVTTDIASQLASHAIARGSQIILV